MPDTNTAIVTCPAKIDGSFSGSDIELIGDLKAAGAANSNPAEVASAQDFQRKAQFYLDFVEAENSIGFHAPEEALRIFGESINFARQRQIALRPKQQAALR